MRQNRTLSLKRETLAELTSVELTAVAGGSHVGCGVTDQCVTHPSFDSCPTVPVYDCLSKYIVLPGSVGCAQ